MPVLITRLMRSYVLDRLMLFFPYSLWIHGSIRNIVMCPSDASQIYVDKWPDFETITILPSPALTTISFTYEWRKAGKNPENHFDQAQVPILDHERRLFSTNLESARRLLSELPFFNDHGSIEFKVTRSLIWPAIEDNARQCGYDVDVENGRCQMYYLPDGTTLPTGPSIPCGFRTDRLHKQHAPLVNSAWPSNLGEKTERYIEGLIHNFPSVGVFQENTEELVAFAICYEDGAMGNLYVHPDHRRKSLASFCKSYLSRQVRQRGNTPYSFIMTKNVPSISLNEKLKFVSTKEDLSCIYCTRRKLSTH